MKILDIFKRKTKYQFQIGKKIRYIGLTGVYGFENGKIYTVYSLSCNPQNKTKWVRTYERPSCTLESDFVKI